MPTAVHVYSDLTEVAKNSLEQYPHLWKRQGVLLINEKHQISISKEKIIAYTSNGIELTHSFGQLLHAMFCVSYSKLIKIYDQYRTDCYFQDKERHYPLDLIYAFCEDMENNILDWRGNENFAVINSKLDITLRLNNLTINNMPIKHNQRLMLLKQLIRCRSEHIELSQKKLEIPSRRVFQLLRKKLH